ncbi:hypothetical protein [Mycobacterium paragordonae]|uniref:ARB-07466-like C-terminal domain-containing protein n=1 Tax=Mycobacterium paragordonae TaxID=1389713 RepID=A0AAJ1W7B8_9MYCO|nr:hypothetical protein [Mycobacterium paragordonae]MDP7739551.1 hypothetical protein [Mycobacterium paragordonae]
MSVGEFVAGVDRLLTRGHGLFPAGGGGGGGVFAAGGGDGGVSVPEVPGGGSRLAGGVVTAGGQYSRARASVVGLDVESGQASGEGAAAGASGRAGAGAIRDQARVVGAAAGPLASSPAGVRLVVATMEEHLAAMQRQVQATTEQNRVLALRLRQLAMGYRGMGGGGMGGLSSVLSGMGSMPSLGGGGGGLSGLSGLAGLPTSLMGRGFGGVGGVGGSAGGVVGRSVGGELGPGVASEKGLQRDTILAARAVSAAFPEIRTIGGVRPDSLKWHPNGQAIDVMIPDPTSAHGKALGDAVMRFAMAHRGQFNINHVIWQQTIHNPDGSSSLMENRGSPTQNHMDHVHIATNGGGFPRGGESYRL